MANMSMAGFQSLALASLLKWRISCSVKIKSFSKISQLCLSWMQGNTHTVVWRSGCTAAGGCATGDLLPGVECEGAAHYGDLQHGRQCDSVGHEEEGCCPADG